MWHRILFKKMSKYAKSVAGIDYDKNYIESAKKI